MNNIIKRHEQTIYPCVRIRTNKAGGSGTVIYSEEDPKNPGEYLTFILTNWHVVDDAITIKQVWDSVLKKEVKRDFLQEVTVESFTYWKVSRVVSANAHRGEIVAYDRDHDLAVIRLLSPAKYPYVAKFIPEAAIEELTIGRQVANVGCSLLHDPIVTLGEITSLKEVIDNKAYLMVSAAAIFGNSGGATYVLDGEDWYLSGVVSRVTGIQLGFGMDLVPWMTFTAHPARIYEFIREQELHFLIGEPGDNYYKALERRREKQERERRADAHS